MAVKARRTVVDRRPTFLEPLPVREWMRQPVVTVRSDRVVGDVARLMRTRKIRHVPVTDAHERLIGIVTDRDLRQVIFDPVMQERLRGRAAALERLTVERVMTWGVLTVQPTTDLREAARLMHERKIGALPVVDGRRVVGILTESDVLYALEQALRGRVVRPRPLHDAGTAQDYDYGYPLPDAERGRDNEEPS